MMLELVKVEAILQEQNELREPCVDCKVAETDPISSNSSARDRVPEMEDTVFRRPKRVRKAVNYYQGHLESTVVEHSESCEKMPLGSDDTLEAMVLGQEAMVLGHGQEETCQDFVKIESMEVEDVKACLECEMEDSAEVVPSSSPEEDMSGQSSLQPEQFEQLSVTTLMSMITNNYIGPQSSKTSACLPSPILHVSELEDCNSQDEDISIPSALQNEEFEHLTVPITTLTITKSYNDVGPLLPAVSKVNNNSVGTSISTSAEPLSSVRTASKVKKGKSKSEKEQSLKQSTRLLHKCFCGFRCRTKKCLKEHWKTAHRDHYPHYRVRKACVAGPFKCTTTKEYTVQERPCLFTCSDCPYAAAAESRLKAHKVVHSEERPFACTQCDYRTKRRYGLRLHTSRVHSVQEKRFKCTDCSFSAYKNSYLQRHQLMHSAEKRLACALCEFRTNHNHSLKKHMMQHTGERPFKCHVPGCSYTAVFKNNFQNHVKSKHS